ncbi:hypothetical protein B0H15DRAFT_441651 [Mycena belliarum]|uniref:Uncharacterized protein n=1 Tax=Mycena belliarum TaxID=1033014 RepID=A0AAD6TWX4_9AGAR|nr:hypothetical protein B0H15DRAFT_441651 [Mycena belliae]
MKMNPKGQCYCQARAHPLSRTRLPSRSPQNTAPRPPRCPNHRAARARGRRAPPEGGRPPPRRRRISHPRRWTTKRMTVSHEGLLVHTCAGVARRPTAPEEQCAGRSPATVLLAPAALLDTQRPWRDLGCGGVMYVPAPALDGEGEAKRQDRSRKTKEKAKGNGAAVAKASVPTILDHPRCSTSSIERYLLILPQT